MKILANLFTKMDVAIGSISIQTLAREYIEHFGDVMSSLQTLRVTGKNIPEDGIWNSRYSFKTVKKKKNNRISLKCTLSIVQRL